MCTAITYKTSDFYFGRTLDYDFSYSEEITITPRCFPLCFRHMGQRDCHLAIIGMAHIAENYPLYYDAINEKGLGMAGLNFQGYADFKQPCSGKDNIASFELIPWILCQCESVAEAKELLNRMNLTSDSFSEQLPPAQLHWIIADKDTAITVESVKDGIRIYENTAGVLTNNPPFNEQMLQLSNYMQLSASEPLNRFSLKLDLHPYSRGMGAIGLPGDLSSQSRFVRAAFTKLNSLCESKEEKSVSQFFHILGTVSQTRGCCQLENGRYEITIYTSCCNASKGMYYYTTYDNHQICAVDMHREDLNSKDLIRYPLQTEEQIWQQN